MDEAKPKTLKVGKITVNTDKQGRTFETVQLGDNKNKDPKYNYTVQIRVLDANGEVIYKGENPYLNLYAPHEKAPKFIKSELRVKLA